MSNTNNQPGDPTGQALSNLEETLIEYLALYMSEVEDIVVAIRPILDAIDTEVDKADAKSGGTRGRWKV